MHGRDLRRHLWDIATAARPPGVSFFDVLEGLELAVLAGLGSVVFIGINLLIWGWVQDQGVRTLVLLYLVVLGSVILSVFRDLARLRLGPVTAALGVSWLCCVLWVGFHLE